MTDHYEIVYVSKCHDLTTAADIIDLILQGRSRNLFFDVTGLLIIANDRFYQWLEGPKTNVLDIYSSIQKDPRHYDVRIIGENFLGVPLFNDSRLRIVTNLDFVHENILNDICRLSPEHETALALSSSESINILAKYSF